MEYLQFMLVYLVTVIDGYQSTASDVPHSLALGDQADLASNR